jgi:hypothetical protein
MIFFGKNTDLVRPRARAETSGSGSSQKFSGSLRFPLRNTGYNPDNRMFSTTTGINNTKYGNLPTVHKQGFSLSLSSRIIFVRFFCSPLPTYVLQI